MQRPLVIVLTLLLAAVAGGWWITAPVRTQGDPFAGQKGDIERGREVFLAGGCASCHAAPGAEGDARLVLAGGEPFATPFGTFYAPNISPSEQGIGDWSAKDLMDALTHGTSPQGRHYYPALPYASYRHLTAEDGLSLHSYLKTLPPSAAESRPHEVGFPFSVRRGLGLWKLLFMGEGWVMQSPATEQIARGRYLVEGLGHCAECHTPRNVLGGLDLSRWLQGAPTPSGRGRVPAIAGPGFDWSEDDIAYYLETGLKPDYDTTGGLMADVVENWSQMPSEDRAAVAAYLKALP